MKNLLYNCIYELPLGIAAVLAGYGLLGAPKQFVVLGILISAVIILCNLVRYQKANGKIILAGTILIGIAGCILLVKRSERILFIKDHLWVLWMILFGIALTVLHELCMKHRFMKLMTSAILLFAILLSMFLNKTLPNVCVAMVLFYCLMSFAEELQCRWTKEGYRDLKGHMVFISPFLMPVLIMLCLVTPPKEPFGWTKTKEFMKQARIWFEVLNESLSKDKGWDKDDAMIGFTDRGDIRGNIGSSSYDVMKMKFTGRHDYGEYYAGKTFDTFDGQCWIKEDMSTTDYINFDCLETAGAVLGNYPDTYSDYMQRVTASVEYCGTKTRYAFLPPKVLQDTEKAGYRCIGGDCQFEESQLQNYDVSYYRLNYDDEDFIDILKSEYRHTKDSWEKMLDSMQITDQETYSFEAFEEYESHIKEQYLLPVELSEEMTEYLNEILEGAESDYEKLKKIEECLLTFTYSENPGKIPDRISTPGEFLDYFMLKKQKGFCSHYATAFVLLARAQGIPARYVQGYRGYPRRGEASVTTAMAHSWPEAYIEGVGWILFEPTPGYEIPRGWKKFFMKNKAPVVEPYEYRGPTNLHENDDSVLDLNALQKNARGSNVNLKGLLQLGLVVVIFILLVILAECFRRRYRYSKMNQRQKALFQCRKMIKKLARYGCRLQDTETLYEFRERMKGQITDEIVWLLKTYEQISYSPMEVSVEMLQKIEKILTLEKGEVIIKIDRQNDTTSYNRLSNY